MEISQAGIKFIVSFEGFRENAYLDVANVPTIGFGTIRYEDGSSVKLGDTITIEQAEQLFQTQLRHYTDSVNNRVTSLINQNQFDSLTSFAYNVGTGNFSTSTLLKKVNVNPSDPLIEKEFGKWNKARRDGKLVVVKGLTRRRSAESFLYFS